MWMGFSGTTALDITFEGWFKNIGVDIKKVPYRNPVEAVNDLAAGRVQVYESAYAIARPQIQAGKIKVLAVTNTARASAIPDIPTVAEAGYPALTMDGLVGLFGPPTMPKDLRERIAADIRTVMDADPLIKDRLITTAQVPNPGGPAEFAKSIDEQRAVLTKAAKDLGITLATADTGSRSASRMIATICPSVKRAFRIVHSESGASLSRNCQPEPARAYHRKSVVCSSLESAMSSQCQ